jgi:hypothetical protein
VPDERIDLAGQIREHPYGAVAAAAGVGFVLGGGLFTRLTGRAAGAAFRLALVALLPLVQDRLLRAAGRALEPASSPPATPPL